MYKSECRLNVRNLAHFASREAMDIEGLGISVCQALINSGLAVSPAELYSLDVQSVAQLDRMGEKIGRKPYKCH